MYTLGSRGLDLNGIQCLLHCPRIGTRRCNHIKSVLIQLHWLLGRQRVSYACSSVSELPGWRLPTRHWRRRQTIAFCRHSNTGRRSHKKLIWRQNIRGEAACSGTVYYLTQDTRQP